jgi:hypothetical protein
MQLFVNNIAIDLLPGMKVIHALIGTGLDSELKRGEMKSVLTVNYRPA